MTEEPLCFITSLQLSLLSYSITSLDSMSSQKALSHSLPYSIGITADLQREEVSDSGVVVPPVVLPLS